MVGSAWSEDAFVKSQKSFVISDDEQEIESNGGFKLSKSRLGHRWGFVLRFFMRFYLTKRLSTRTSQKNLPPY